MQEKLSIEIEEKDDPVEIRNLDFAGKHTDLEKEKKPVTDPYYRIKIAIKSQNHRKKIITL